MASRYYIVNLIVSRDFLSIMGQGFTESQLVRILRRAVGWSEKPAYSEQNIRDAASEVGLDPHAVALALGVESPVAFRSPEDEKLDRFLAYCERSTTLHDPKYFLALTAWFARNQCQYMLPSANVTATVPSRRFFAQPIRPAVDGRTTHTYMSEIKTRTPEETTLARLHIQHVDGFVYSIDTVYEVPHDAPAWLTSGLLFTRIVYHNQNSLWRDPVFTQLASRN